MTKLCVVRPHLSPYLANNYAKTEKTFSESMGMSYSSEIPNNDDYILITDTHVDINQLSTDELQRLKLVIHPNSGVDNLNLELLKTCSIPLIAGNPIRANAVAEYILSIVFNHFSSPRFQKRWNMKRQWQRPLLQELNILLIGHGHIGRLVNNNLSSLGARLLVHDPNPRFLIENAEHIHLDNYDLKSVDIVILAASFNDSAIINKEVLNRFNDEIVIINPSRGKHIETQPLIDFLISNPKSTAYLDVLENEPPSDEFLNQIEPLNNLFMSSHIAGVYENISKAMLDFEKKVLEDFIHLSLEDFLRRYKDLVI